MKTVDDAITSLLEGLEREQARVGSLIAWMREHREAIEDIGIVPSHYGTMFDFDNPTREQVLKIIKAFPGRWDKSPCSDGEKINYTTVFNGQPLRIWAGDPPETCKIVEETVFVPERYETRKRIVCKGEDAAQANEDAQLEATQQEATP